MKKKYFKKIVTAIIAAAMSAALFSGCTATPEAEDKETITVYLWTTVLYEKYGYRYEQ